MSLERYSRKRKFNKTPEPVGRIEIKKKKELSFVVQKHDASSLHFDFRLEMDGVLKSWAVPKGPSMDHDLKRLAIEVEDHPLEYVKFHGKIPKGNYGAGTVEIWDKGSYTTKFRDEDMWEFRLNGKKLNGMFTLIRIKNRLKKASKKDIGKNWLLIKNKSDLGETDIMIGKQKVEVTNINKVFWPKEGYTKGDLIDYYRKISSVLLPYLKDRPESLLRYPDGISGENFYHKDMKIAPRWVKKIVIKSEENKRVHYLLCQDEATLIYMINLGCIDLNPWNSRVGHLDDPDYMIMDIDPEETSFENVVETALAVREVMESAGIPSFPKTSGASGIHIYSPLKSKYSYQEIRDLARTIAEKVHDRLPKITSLERHPSERKGKVYLDCFQNARGQTLAAPYSVRAKPGATVSTPLEWEEVNTRLTPQDFTIKNIFQRIEKKGDLFKPVLEKGFDIKKALKKLAL